MRSNPTRDTTCPGLRWFVHGIITQVKRNNISPTTDSPEIRGPISRNLSYIFGFLVVWGRYNLTTFNWIFQNLHTENVWKWSNHPKMCLMAKPLRFSQLKNKRRVLPGVSWGTPHVLGRPRDRDRFQHFPPVPELQRGKGRRPFPKDEEFLRRVFLCTKKKTPLRWGH